ncbi:methyl-accepting chemotaxis protein [Kineothrix sp. MB12-C1]|uniref:methyl-accepting chemotaxis protein n=1 Tax=Kineothrix sp. MB12-C1 TaxID=3070215 RepID=UPI0027D1FD18|nr:methyl-accepting chemotaxis protein [Kineothrix sp. MB12-C1]WMC91295.1 methyl-accepting chemotaxis protein [Kineothrix sp. MB12-C1]
MRSIRIKMLITILPIIILGMLFLIINSMSASKSSILQQMDKLMASNLDKEITSISREIREVELMANMITSMVSNTYNFTDLQDYEKLLGDIIVSNNLAMGSGIWFEPYEYDAGEKYVGPYIYKDGDGIAVTYEYSNESYDYFSYEWYKNASASDGKAIFTQPYYDETLGVTMSSCTVPLKTPNGKFIGAVTVDIELSSLQNLVKAAKVGEGGHAFLVDESGIFLSSQDDNKVMAQKIQEEANPSIAQLGRRMLTEEEGDGFYTEDGEVHHVYFKAIPGLNWVLAMEIPEKELIAPVESLTLRMAVISVISIIICFIVVLFMVGRLSANLKKVNHFAGILAQGDLTKDGPVIKGRDELNQLSTSLNNMFRNNKLIISKIADSSERLTDTGSNLIQASEELAEQFKNIAGIMNIVNDNMMSSSASTEEVNASVEEVNSSANVLLAETERSNELAGEIGQRAAKIKENSNSSYQKATDMSKVYERELSQSMENAKVVESVSVLANVISEIADQINLLSLNAAIEAARAGEQGRGFAVVAGEIGKLAGETASAVGEIQDTTGKIEEAFRLLIHTANELLRFITETVAPDYEGFVHSAHQYEEDAGKIKEFSEKISEMSTGIEHIIGEVSQAIQSIAYSAQNTSDSSGKIMDAISVMETTMQEVEDMSREQNEMADQLHDVVNKFKL